MWDLSASTSLFSWDGHGDWVQVGSKDEQSGNDCDDHGNHDDNIDDDNDHSEDDG